MTIIQGFVSSLEGRALLLLLSLAIWASIVLTAAWLAAARLRGASPAARYCVWQFALIGLLVVPLLFVILPGVPLGWRLQSSEHDRVVEQLAINSTGRLRLRAVQVLNGSRPHFDLTDPEQSRGVRSEKRIAHQIAAAPVAGQTTKPTKLPGNVVVVASPAASKPAWPVALLRLWIAGAAIQLLWLAAAAARGWLLAWRARPLSDERIQRSLDEMRRRLGVRRRVKLLTTRIPVPTVLGAIFPAILLPTDCDSWSDERLRIVLAHELAHVERRDVFWQLLARVVAVPYWFHPLVWLAIRRMRQEREQACDDRVLQSGIEATDYAAALVDVASALRGVRLPMPLGVGIAHRSNLENRVRSILDASLERGPASARTRRAILTATAGIVLVLGLLRPFSPVRSRAADIKAASGPMAKNPTAPQTNARPNPASPTAGANSAAAKALAFDKHGNQITTGKLHLQIRGPDGKPLAGVHVFANASTRDEVVNHSYITKASGDLDVVLPHAIDSLRLFVDHHGFVSEFLDWEKPISGLRPPTGLHVPEQYTIRMRRGDVIGGVVVDEKNKPIAGAAMLINSKQSGLLSNGDVKTDTHGRWRLDSFPPGDNSEVRVAATHPDYVSMRSHFNLSTGEEPTPMKDLRAQSAVTVMKHGVRVTGKITSPDGKPVADALAIWGDEPYWQHLPQQEVRSDKNGVYRLPPLHVGPMRLTTVAKGWMPEMRMLNIRLANPPVDFRLKPGKKLCVRLVDSDGKPIREAFFGVDEWRGAKSLYNIHHPNVKDSQIPTSANKQGIYEWTWAPDDAVKYTVTAGSGFSEPEVSFIADDKEHVLVVQRSLQITGQVTDAATGRAIDKFTFVPVIDFGNGLFATERDRAAVGRNGKFALMPQDRTDAAIRVRIEADGYRTARSGPFRVGDSKTTWNFKLEPAAALRGRVLQAGRGVAGVKVYLATQSQDFNWPRDKFEMTNNFSVSTDGGGEFSLPAQFEEYRLIAITDGGYADVARTADQSCGDLVLKKWAYVEGQLFQAGKSVPHAEIFLSDIDAVRFGGKPYINDMQFAETDANGRFVFDRVPPKKCTVDADLSPWETFPITSSQYIPLDLRPGEHVTVNFGGDGIQATGRVVLKGAPKGIDLNWSLNYLLRMQPGIEPAKEIRSMGFDWRRGWSDAWTTQEGGEYLDTLFHDFVRLGHDGSFLINGLSAGDYQLALQIYKHDDPKACLTVPIARRVIKFTVTPADVAKSHLDLGAIEVEAVRAAQTGEIVPDFEFVTLDGQTKHLSEFRGKYVLLDFWATWCGACVGALPDVHRLAERYGDRLTLVPISLDADQDALRQFVADRKMSGLQGSLGDWSKTNVPAQLGVSSLPSYLLVAPDGKLIINAWSVDQVRDKLSEAMKSAGGTK